MSVAWMNAVFGSHRTRLQCRRVDDEMEIRVARYHVTTHVEWVRATSTNATPPQNIVEGQDHTLHDPPFALS